MSHDDRVIAETRAWVDRAVIGLNLCPFAKAPQVKGLVRYAVSAATDPAALLADLIAELERLAESKPDKLETTLLIHPGVLADFADYNDFLEVAEDTVAELDLEGVIQLGQLPSRLPVRRQPARRHRQCHQPLALPHAAPDPRGEHSPRGRGLPRGRDDLRDQHRDAGKTGRRRLGGAAAAVPGRRRSGRNGRCLIRPAASPHPSRQS